VLDLTSNHTLWVQSMSDRGTIGLKIDVQEWPLTTPFRTSSTLGLTASTVTVSLKRANATGQGEASGVYYRGETTSSMVAEIESVRADVEAGIERTQLCALLPPGGARNAIDCAMWALEADETGIPVWQRAGLNKPVARQTTITLGANSPEAMADNAKNWGEFSAIKIKLLGDGDDGLRVAAVRAARPDVWLAVDANQSLNRAQLVAMLPNLMESRVSLIEQPVPKGEDETLLGLASPIMLGADESVDGVDSLASLSTVYGAVSIKLDKTGGLTQALELARAARGMGLSVMVGNMLGTSLAMAPAFLVAQLCDVVDLDGPLLLARDRDDRAIYHEGTIDCPPSIWG
jgi:L-Ala-D/L-Glu epimerase